MPDRISVCVAIPTYLREQFLVATVQEVLAQDPPADEVLVIDQTPQHEPDTTEFLQEAASSFQIRWIRQDQPSLTAARNRALLETTCDIVVFIDDDVLLKPVFFAAHWKNYLDAEVAAVAGRVLSPSDEKGESIPEMPKTRDPKRFALAVPANLGVRLERVSFLRGNNHSVRVSAAKSVGGYDEQWVGPAHFEEFDLAFRMARAGMRIVYDPEAAIVHLGAPTGGCRVLNNKIWTESSKSANGIAFGLRHFGWLIPWPVWRLALRAGPLRRENVLSPARWPFAWGAFLAGLPQAYRMANSPVRSPFVQNV